MDVILPDWPAPDNIHAITTTRLQGVSLAPFDQNNLGLYTQDLLAHILKNQKNLQNKHALPSPPIWLTQVHSRHVLNINDTPPHLVADGSYTTRSGRVCAVLTADCLPILICDTAGQTVCALHAGWRSLARGIIERALIRLNLAPQNVLVWLGPAIGPAHFEVGDEVREIFISQDPKAKTAFQAHQKHKWLTDIYQLARIRLESLAIKKIYGANYCTFSDNTLFYSYRREGITGRQATIIWRD